MRDPLFPYYERELDFIRHSVEEFARRYPAAAGRLLLGPGQSDDPHVERLIEAFALIAGRIRLKLDDEFPELTEGMLGVLYPHYTAPIPSMALAQFTLDPSRAQLPHGFEIAPGSRLRTHPIHGLPCRYRTGGPTTIWPIRLVEARFLLPPLPVNDDSFSGAGAALFLKFEALGGLQFSEMSLETLPIFLEDDLETVAALYELFFSAAITVLIRDPDAGSEQRPFRLEPDEAIRQFGFDNDQGLLPYPDHAFPGYRLLSEFFAFPEKFQFVELSFMKQERRANFGRRLEVIILFDRGSAKLEHRVSAQTFQLGCAPVVNLFEKTAEPIPLDRKRFEYRVVPDVVHKDGMEIYSIDRVEGVDPSSGTSPYRPFFAFGPSVKNASPAMWYAVRRSSTIIDDPGTEVELSIVDMDFRPTDPGDRTLIVWTTCTNRDLPSKLRAVGALPQFEVEMAAPFSEVRCLRGPTSSIRPPLQQGAYWRLISHLNLNHLSLSNPSSGLEALQELLQLYVFNSGDLGLYRREAAIAAGLIGGITGLEARRVLRRVSDEEYGGFARGIEVTVEFDEEHYIGTGVILFASVLERFFGLYASINSFTQLVARLKRADTIIKRWPPRSGSRPLI